MTTKNRKYRFQVVDVSPAMPANINCRWSRRRWKRRNRAFQIVDGSTGNTPPGYSPQYSDLKEAKKIARDLNVKLDGRKARISTRAKKYFSTFQEVAKIWADHAEDPKRQSDARCKQGMFEGAKIWSYGNHYLAGEFVRSNGQLVCLTNSKYYSRTTSGHIYTARSYAIKVVGELILYCDFGKHGDGSQAVPKALKQRADVLRKDFADMSSDSDFDRWQFQDSQIEVGNPTFSGSHLETECNEFNQLCVQLGRKDLRISFSTSEINNFDIQVAHQFARKQCLKRKQLEIAI